MNGISCCWTKFRSWERSSPSWIRIFGNRNLKFMRREAMRNSCRRIWLPNLQGAATRFICCHFLLASSWKIFLGTSTRALIDVLSSSVGSLSSAEKITNTFHSEKKSKITRNTVAKFIDYLEDAFLISSASRYDIKGKRYIGAPKKFYFADLGLRKRTRAGLFPEKALK